MRIWLVGGGTAGHVSPLLSLAPELSRQAGDSKLQINVITDRSPAVLHLLAGAPDYEVKRILSGKFRRYRGRSWWSRLFDIKTLLLNLRDTLLILAGTLQSLSLVLKEKPRVIFINGGSVGVPVALAARLARIPYIVHESDTVMGLANRMVAPHARVVATAFDANFGSSLAGKTVCTGIPLKEQFLQPPDEKTLNNLKNGLNLDSTLPVVLALGGSLGAERLNNWLISQVDDLLDKCQLILVSGRANYLSTQATISTLRPALVSRLHLLEFSDRVADLMRIADVVVTRAGATTLMEIAATGRPALIIPNDMLSGGHQSANALWFVSAGMAESLPEAAIASDPGLLVRGIHSLIEDEPRRNRLAQAVAKVHRPDSSEVLAGLILKAGRGD